jgi:predicted transcriptional regulator
MTELPEAKDPSALQKIIQHLAEKAQAEARRHEEEAIEKILSVQERLVAAVYSSASAYTAVVIFGGYAGFFALWQLTKEHLARWQELSAALLMLLSVLSFVLFEVFKMIESTNGVYRKSAAMTDPENLKHPDDLLKVLDELARAETQASKGMLVWWRRSIWLCLGTALPAVLILVIGFVTGLFKG